MTEEKDFLQACATGDRKEVYRLLTAADGDQYNIDQGLIFASQNNQISLVRYLLTSKDLPRNANIHAGYDGALRWACAYGHLDLVKYLLTSEELIEHADIHAEDEEALAWACADGCWPIIRYLLTSPELTEHASINNERNKVLREVCNNGRTDVLQYLLYDKELKERGKITPVCYEWAAYYIMEEPEDIEIMCYLLSLRDENKVAFEDTEFNLQWAMVNEIEPKIIHAMMVSLLERNFMEYLSWITKYQTYCHDKNIEIPVSLKTVPLELDICL